MIMLAPLVLAVAPAAAPIQALSAILEVTTDADGKVISVKVVSVIDPLKGGAHVKAEVPDSWLAAARAEIEAKPDQPRSKTYYTYYTYYPGVPFMPR